MSVRPLSSIALGIAVAFGAAVSSFAQSTSQEFPTAVTASEIAGIIKARDVGDSRLTAYYYTFNSEQGDLFINLVTRNFTGDIDVFTANGLRPVTKIVVYADYGDAETGRAVYFRKAERLILRVQGRSPNDDAATFRLKFAGSFAALKGDEVPAEPEPPKVSAESLAGVRVNSAGTILPPLPKPVETIAEKTKGEPETDPKAEESRENKPTTPSEPAMTGDKDAASPPSLILTDPLKDKAPMEKKTPARRVRNTPARRTQPKVPPKAATETEPGKQDENTVAAGNSATGSKPAGRVKPAPAVRSLNNSRRSSPAAPPAEPKPDPLASINLVIQFKDGNLLEKRMSDVFKFSVDKGILTVILKDGSISRYPIVDVARVTIE